MGKIKTCNAMQCNEENSSVLSPCLFRRLICLVSNSKSGVAQELRDQPGEIPGKARHTLYPPPPGALAMNAVFTHRHPESCVAPSGPMLLNPR